MAFSNFSSSEKLWDPETRGESLCGPFPASLAIPVNSPLQQFNLSAQYGLDFGRDPTETAPFLDQNMSTYSPQEYCPEETFLQTAGSSEGEECSQPSVRSHLSPSEAWTQLSVQGSPAEDLCDPIDLDKHEPDLDATLGQKKGRTSSCGSAKEAHLRAKQAHSVVERRYRGNLNDKMMKLHRTLNATESTWRVPIYGSASSPQRCDKVKKADIMTNAINYVHQSEVEMRHMTDEIQNLEDRIQYLQKLVDFRLCSIHQDAMMT